MTPIEHHQKRVNTILANFQEAEDLSKAITPTAFKAQYADHQVFSKENLIQYAADKLAKGKEEGLEEQELVKGIENEFQSLQPVLVLDEKTNQHNRLFVRKA
jgi:hypothetical protein